MSCITQADMAKVENQVLQYEIARASVMAEYQAEYDKRIPYQRYSGDTGNEKSVLLRLTPLTAQMHEARRQRDEFKKMEIREDIEKKKAQQAQVVATERIKELEEQLILSGEEFSTVKAKHQTLTNQYIIAIAVIVLIVILFFRRRA